VTSLGGVRIKKELPKIAAHGKATSDQLIQAMRIDDLLANYHLFAIPKPIIHRGEAMAIACWIENELKTSLPNKRDLLGKKEEWEDWLNRNPTDKTSDYYARIKYLDQLCWEFFPDFKHSVLLGLIDIQACTLVRRMVKRESWQSAMN